MHCVTRITSYINNLHPKMHRPLYHTIEQIIDLTIPLWNKVLTPLTVSNEIVPRIVYSKCEYDPNQVRPELPDRDENGGFNEEMYVWEQDHAWIIRPEPEDFRVPLEDPDCVLDLKRQFKNKGIQVIVKLANIHLTPEKPEYGGGTWHVEGQLVRSSSSSSIRPPHNHPL
jgi:hypothetical protein